MKKISLDSSISLYFSRLQSPINPEGIQIADLCTNSSTGLSYSRNKF